MMEMWRYCREIIDDPACPLDSAEKEMARENLSRMVLRNSVRMLMKGRVENAMRMALRTGIPWSEWHAILHPYKKPYLREADGENPIHIGIGASPVVAARSRRSGTRGRLMSAHSHVADLEGRAG
jgi:hypothetical protein